MLKIAINGNKKTPIIITVAVCITLLEIVALFNGINGVLLTTVIAILAALAGLSIPTPKIMRD